MRACRLRQPQKGLIKVLTFHYYGHSAFLLNDGKYRVLVDPFLTGNPKATITADEVECDYILVSHGHGDHLGDAPTIARRTKAEVVAIPEILGLIDEGITTHGMNIGGSLNLPFGKVRMVFAQHSSGIMGGIACGFVVYIGGMVVYYAGDTALFSDMKLIGQKDNLDVAILPIGDNYTMGLEDAAMAAKLLNARHVIPVHYDTWDVIEQDAAQYKKVTESNGHARVHIVKPGEDLELTLLDGEV